MKKSVLAIMLATVVALNQPISGAIAAKLPEGQRNVQEGTDAEKLSDEDIAHGCVPDSISYNGSFVNSISENSVSDNSVSENGMGNIQTDAADSVPERESPKKLLPLTASDTAAGDTVQAAGTDGQSTGQAAEMPQREIDLSGISITGIEMATYKSVKLTWNKIADAESYQIFRSTKKSGPYQLIKTVSASSLSCTDKARLAAGKKYYYKVRPAANGNGGMVYGNESGPQMITYSLPRVKLKSVKTAAGGTLQLKWTRVKGADGYEIRRSTAEKGKYKRLKTVESATAQKCTLTASEANGQYYYKVRAYRIVKRKKVYGDYSAVKEATVSNFTYAGESYPQKCMRIFGTGWYKYYPSESAARKSMTTITVKVWDFDAGGNKVTRQKSFLIHKNLAATVEQIFKEIYEGKEKFPIKAVGGFSWRGNGSTSEHNQGTAIDINPNENYMIEGNGTISSGSLWKPGSNPYSIPANGEVVRIFKKYGFGWGGNGWSSGRRDYMHFSYFGT